MEGGKQGGQTCMEEGREAMEEWEGLRMVECVVERRGGGNRADRCLRRKIFYSFRGLLVSRR